MFLVLILTSCAEKLTPEERHASGGEPDPETLKELETFVGSVGGIYEAEDTNLISVYLGREESEYLENISVITRFADECDLPVFVAIPPRKMDALTSSLPEDFPFQHSERLFALVEREVEKSEVEYVDLFFSLKGKSESAGQLYYKTDHHWTHEGAWRAYVAIVEKMGKKPLLFEEFTKLDLIEEFRGSDFTKKNTSDATDKVTGAYPEGKYTLEVVSSPYDSGENNRTIDGFFDFDKLHSSEPYAVFLGGNTPYIRVRGEGENRETLLVVRDSFANALSPYLAYHFDLVLIDPRFFPTGLSDVALGEGADAVLILENMGSLTEHKIKFMW